MYVLPQQSEQLRYADSGSHQQVHLILEVSTGLRAVLAAHHTLGIDRLVSAVQIHGGANVALFVDVAEFHLLVDAGNAAVRALQEQQ
ncbi:hypothetical protein [Rhodococcus cercidiphylli]|uniref:Uncharacterized protein n=1 Tax=Rhodococcus cercidiphylli TaxID=489916 RepID=A0ABU4AZV3_9NOCA|nr:hypothetical protein [Rhodococcus cercidiphylli]MDV6231777.1 hypothetical protein [Rhodococcus cercidiphylli]